MATQPNILDVGYRSTNYWLLDAGRGGLLVDLGWPGTLGQFDAVLRRRGVDVGTIRHGIATHYHPDHAGLADELKRRGMELWIVDLQLEAVPRMRQWMKPADRYVDIDTSSSRVVTLSESRSLLAELGLGGEILATPGHSDDSVSILLDGGEAFTGDLTPLPLTPDEQHGVMAASWEALRTAGAREVFPGHGPTYRLELSAE